MTWMGQTSDPDAPKSPGQMLYERWRDGEGENAEELWECLAASVAANVRDPGDDGRVDPEISDRDEKLAG